MGTTRIRIDPSDPRTLPVGRVDYAVLDATTEQDIARQRREDDAEAMQDMARFARRVRRRLGLTQVDLARCISVPNETIRNWELGKRSPTGPERALLKIMDEAPETALSVLT
jgi:putative transcriptional regulator